MHTHTARKHTGKRQQSRTAKKRIPAKPAQPPVTSPAKTMKPKAKSKDDDGSRKSPTKARGPSKNPVRVGSSGEGGEGGEGGVGKGEGSAAQHQDGERGGADVTEEPVAMESVCEAGDPPSDDVTSPKTTEKSRTGTPGTKKPMHSFFGECLLLVSVLYTCYIVLCIHFSCQNFPKSFQQVNQERNTNNKR